MKLRSIQLLIALTSLAAFAAKLHVSGGFFDGH
jgi:hypothetical protein